VRGGACAVARGPPGGSRDGRIAQRGELPPFGGSSMWRQTSATPEGFCALAVTETERRLGPIDLLVVNHGIASAHERLVWEQDPEVGARKRCASTSKVVRASRDYGRGGSCKRGFGRLRVHQSTDGEKAERSG